MSTNIPVTVWQNTSGNGEFAKTGVQSIVDTTGTSLVDTAGIQIVDTGVTFTQIPQSVWTENDAS